jgi:hypothetical protein
LIGPWSFKLLGDNKKCSLFVLWATWIQVVRIALP